MRVRWRVIVPLLVFLVVPLGGVQPQTTASAQAIPDCSGIPQYAKQLEEAFAMYNAALMSSLSEDLSSSVTISVDGTAIATPDQETMPSYADMLLGQATAADEFVTALERIEPPPVATLFHQNLIELDRLVAKWLREMAAPDFSAEASQGFDVAIQQAAVHVTELGTAAVSTCPAFQQVLDVLLAAANSSGLSDEGMP